MEIVNVVLLLRIFIYWDIFDDDYSRKTGSAKVAYSV